MHWNNYMYSRISGFWFWIRNLYRNNIYGLISCSGKKGFGYKRIILLSDLGGEFADDGIDKIIAGIKGSGAELNVMWVHVYVNNYGI